MSDPKTTPDGDGGYEFIWEHEHPSLIVKGYIKKSGSYSVGTGVTTRIFIHILHLIMTKAVPLITL